MNWKQNQDKTGYNFEEYYFDKLNRELINRIKSVRSGKREVPEGKSLAEVLEFRPREDHEKADQEKKAA